MREISSCITHFYGRGDRHLGFERQKRTLKRGCLCATFSLLFGQFEKVVQTLREIQGVRVPRNNIRQILAVLVFRFFNLYDGVGPTRKFINKLLLFLPLTYLSWEPQACGHTTHCRGHQVVQVPVCRIAQFEGSEAYVIQSLVVDAVSFIGVFNELMHWKCSVVRLHNCVRDLKEVHKEKYKKVSRRNKLILKNFDNSKIGRVSIDINILKENGGGI